MRFGADLAERYFISETEPDIEAGDVVSIDYTSSGASPTVSKSKRLYDPQLIGIISTNPGLVLGPTELEKTQRLVALAGRVPTKVSLEGGEIRPGDFLTSSNILGVAMKKIS